MPDRSSQSSTSAAPVYSPLARRFHWWTVAFVFVMIPLGFAMSRRGNDLNIWDATTNNMYSAHKLLGFIVLWLMVARLIYRLSKGAPPDEPTLEWWQKAASHLTHWGLYGLLLLLPITGWIGVSLFGATDIFGIFRLPSLAAQNQDTAKLVLSVHKIAAILLVLAILAHIGAAIYHHVIRKDGVLRRMLPSIGRRD